MQSVGEVKEGGTEGVRGEREEMGVAIGGKVREGRREAGGDSGVA
jgi:hypothetical protein